jgi:hypothetical protein
MRGIAISMRLDYNFQKKKKKKKKEEEEENETQPSTQWSASHIGRRGWSHHPRAIGGGHGHPPFFFFPFFLI